MVEALFSKRGVYMTSGGFCFISDKYYKDFQDEFLMRNKDMQSIRHCTIRKLSGMASATLSVLVKYWANRPLFSSKICVLLPSVISVKYMLIKMG